MSTHSFTVWISRMPHARFATSIPRAAKTLASDPPPVDRVGQARPSARRGALHQRDDAGVVRHVQAIVLMVDVDLHPRLVLAPAHAHRPPRGDVQEAAAHGFRLRLELRRAEAARLAADDDAIGHDIGREAALDHPEIRGGLRVEAAEAHRRYRFRRHLDGREPLLGADPRVGGEPVDGEREPIGPGGSRDELGHAVHVQHEPAARASTGRCRSAWPPSSPDSSQIVSTTSMSPWGIPRPRTTRIASKIATMPALSSPPRTLVPSVRTTSPSTMGRIAAAGPTVSM